MFFTMQYLEVTCGVFISTKIHVKVIGNDNILVKR